MSESPDNPSERLDAELTDQIGAKEERKLKAREKEKHALWFGLGMFGVVGWSVAIPAVAGIAIGCWLDATYPSHISWCLTFLFLGIAIGAMIAWNWIKREGKPD